MIDEMNYRIRKIKNLIFYMVLICATAIAILPLLLIVKHLAAMGLASLDWAFFTELPKPVGEVGGGLANSILGTLILIGLASIIGIPIGVLTAVFLSEYSSSRLANTVRFCCNILSGIPSIVIGIFVHGIAVVPFGKFTALAGGLALSLIMIPVVARQGEGILQLIPSHIREAGLALGIPRYRVILKILIPCSLGGLMTGIFLSVARIAGETAPLMFTALNSRYWPTQFTEPISSLPVQIYLYAISPFETWQNQAWGAAFVLIMIVFALNLVARSLFSLKLGKGVRS